MFSIILLAHDKSEYTRRCLESILRAGVEGVEIVFLDNGSTDDTPDVASEFAARWRQAGGRFVSLREPKNLGCSTARNLCMAAATGKYVVLLDNDTLIVDPQWLGKMAAVLEEAPENRIVGPKLCYPFEPHLIQCAGVAISKSGRVQFRGRGEPQDAPRFNRKEPVQALISACMMFDADLPREIGGLDEAFNPIQYEDLDFCYRARSRGWRVIYTPDPVVWHWESVTSEGTAALPNKYIVIKHGLLFKQRWRHVFEQEDGPPDAETVWRSIERPRLPSAPASAKSEARNPKRARNDGIRNGEL